VRAGVCGDVSAMEGARRATEGADTSLAALAGYPWPVRKLVCFSSRSHAELKSLIENVGTRIARRRHRLKKSAKEVVRPVPVAERSEVGGGRAPAKPSAWALAAAFEAYMEAHSQEPRGQRRALDR